MTSEELRQKYLDFFSKKRHKVILPSPLVLENDPTTLFTSSGMQPLIPYLLGQPHPQGKRLVDIQPSLRVDDIDEVGDNRHTTFFEMLGNWSLGDYFKQEQLTWFWEFLTQEIKFDPARLYVTIFEGNDQIPRDTESEEIWKSLGVPPDHIYFYGVKKNWWSRSGTPEQMPPGEIGGPDSEVFYEFTQVEHNKKYGEKCQPNCECGRFLEIGNSVFIEYQKQEDGTFKKLPQRNVDFGGGLERITAASNNNPDIFQTDLYKPIIDEIVQVVGTEYGKDNKTSMRIIADHIKATTFLIKNGIVPSNKLQGYILRRLLRRAIVKLNNFTNNQITILGELVDATVNMYKDINYFKDMDEKYTKQIVWEELDRFKKTLDKGLKEIDKIDQIDGKKAFDLYQTFGFPYEVTEELFRQKRQAINQAQYRAEFEKHRESSRNASAGMFKGGLADSSKKVIKYHTATHLLHAALRQILGTHVQQKGSNITTKRLRFDFSHPEKLTEEQIKEVENLINQEIRANLPVTSEVMGKEEALDSGAVGFFTEKYGDKVTVYTIGGPSTLSVRSGSLSSREICGGPHVKNTAELGHFKITKEESAGAGIRRIYANLT